MKWVCLRCKDALNFWHKNSKVQKFNMMLTETFFQSMNPWLAFA
jgi:hypothetical protein